MKRLLSILLVLAILISIGGCFPGESLPSTEIRDTLPDNTEENSSVPDTTGQTEETQGATEATESTESSGPTEVTEATEFTEPTEPVPEPEDSELVRILDYIPSVRQALAYATVNNFTGQRIYDFTDAYLRYHTVKKLKLVQKELESQGLGLLIWDGFRPVSAQAKLWEICPDPSFVSHPVTGNRSHCRGTAVDVTLIDLKTGREQQMPTGFDNFTDYADRDYSDCTPEAAKNALLLENTMKKHGFKPYSAEWWHFTDTQDYPVDETFNPAVPSLWIANCNEFITLRKTPGSGNLGKILVGETMELLGWDGKYAKVSYKGKVGYVFASYIKPKDDSWLDSCLDVVNVTATYTYDQMLSDLQALHSAYPNITEMEFVGTSELGQKIPVLRIGAKTARHHVLLHGAIHGREYMTTWLLMAMTEYWLDRDLLSYGNVCYHILPMVNPDGVAVSQTKTLTDAQSKIYQRDKAAGYTTDSKKTYASLWKANGLGVDINRNFPASWKQTYSRNKPSSQQYKGEEPFSAAEAKVLQDYTLRYDFDATVSYHATGSLIYYEFGNQKAVNKLSKKLGTAIGTVTGYTLMPSTGIDGGGYKDWAIDALGIPSLTLEIGCQDTPLVLRELYPIFARNLSVLPELARWVQK